MNNLPSSRDIHRSWAVSLDKAIAAPVYFKRNETVFVIQQVKQTPKILAQK